MRHRLTLATGVALALVSAPIAVSGLAAIFTPAFIPIGVGLEASKLVLAGWLHRRWKTSPRLLRYGLLALVVVQMAFTAAGLAGYLSRAYLTAHTAAGASQRAESAASAARVGAQEQVVRGLEAQASEITGAIGAAVARGRANGAMALRDRLARDRSRIEAERRSAAATLNDLRAQAGAATQAQAEAEAEAGTLVALAAVLGVEVAPAALIRLVTLTTAVVFELVTVLLIVAAGAPTRATRAPARRAVRRRTPARRPRPVTPANTNLRVVK